jgi:thiol-disulfide isomerase/thioredoxin
MKLFFLLLSFVFVTSKAVAQPAEISRDAINGNKIIKGFISKKDLATDTAFLWYAENQKGYTPESKALIAMRTNKDSINIIAFAGTWCSDTKTILPKFFLLTDIAGLSQDRITLIGVDRNKKTIQHLAEAFNIINVPTFIVMKNGKEIGRVVEYGKYGMFDKELGEIISGTSK